MIATFCIIVISSLREARRLQPQGKEQNAHLAAETTPVLSNILQPPTFPCHTSWRRQASCQMSH